MKEFLTFRRENMTHHKPDEKLERILLLLRDETGEEREIAIIKTDTGNLGASLELASRICRSSNHWNDILSFLEVLAHVGNFGSITKTASVLLQSSKGIQPTPHYQNEIQCQLMEIIKENKK